MEVPKSSVLFLLFFLQIRLTDTYDLKSICQLMFDSLTSLSTPYFFLNNLSNDVSPDDDAVSRE
jgi:hypothetical protein